MLPFLPPLFCQAATRAFEFARFRQFDDERWLIALLVGAALLVLTFVATVYRRDSVELKPGVGLLLLLLRLAAFAGLFIFFLQPEMRTDQKLVRSSRVVLLADVSQSMGLSDDDATGVPSGPSRSDRIAAILDDGGLLRALRAEHETVVSRFDESVERVIALPAKPQSFSRNAEGVREATPAASADADDPQAPETDWKTELAPRGTETRIGEAIRDAVERHRNSPLAGIVLMTDGAHNAGIEPDSAIELAAKASVPIFTVGVGSAQQRRNVRVSDFLAPARAYPGDAATATAYLQAAGFGGRLVDVELRRRNADDPDSAWSTVAAVRTALGADGEIVPVPFEITEDAPGRFTFEVRVIPPGGDTNLADNAQQADVEVVDRQLRVLLLASGATREYRFLRNQLRRDEGMEVDVLLQSSPPGISQDADEILAEFPHEKDELYVYDCIVAFDPNWLALDAQQIALLETWVSEEAGGLIVIAGPVHSAAWLDSAEHRKLRDLYPVLFRRGLSILGDGRYGSTTPWPITFSREGTQADFLRLAETPTESERVWELFKGVYGYFAVKGSKPGAVVYATSSDPEAKLGGGKPIYMAGQFFGAGRVFYMASGEMWRLRSIAESHFEVFYTKLLRHVTQGRLLRGSSQGVLLVERDRYLLGDTVVVRAQLKDDRQEPLTARSVDLLVTLPDSTLKTLRLRQFDQQPGNFLGQFRVYQEGTYSLAVIDAASGLQAVSGRIQVRLPELERQRPELNVELLSSIADRTGGLYYGTLEVAVDGGESLRPLAQMIPNREEVQTIRGAPNRDFEERLMKWLLGGICGALFLEWLIRRLSRLA